MKRSVPSLFILASFFSIPALSADPDNLWDGTFAGGNVNLPSIKKLELSKAKDGVIKVKAWVVGFPADVFLGETVAEPYQNARTRAQSDAKSYPSQLLATFTSGKLKAVVAIEPGDRDPNQMKSVYCEAFLRNSDAPNIFVEKTLLGREP